MFRFRFPLLRFLARLFTPKVKLVLIHQMGKVASQTLEQTIYAADPSLSVKRFHFLHPSKLALMEHFLRTGTGTPNFLQSISHDLHYARECAAQLEGLKRAGQRVCVLTGCRDPLDHCIASLFQNIKGYIPEVHLDPARLDEECRLIDRIIRERFGQFLSNTMPSATKERLHFRGLFTQVLTWFDEEFLPVHGVDLYKHQHPDQRGILVIDQGRTRYILYKLETLEREMHSLLKLVPGLPRATTINRNRAREKPCGGLYAEFRRRFVPTPEMMEHFYNNKYFHHFYAGERPRYSLPAAGQPQVWRRAG